jgi:hypothetical protein
MKGLACIIGFYEFDFLHGGFAKLGVHCQNIVMSDGIKKPFS